MRHRITYIQDLGRGDFHPDNIKVSTNSVKIGGLVGAKEHRVTIGLSELPQEITSALEQCHELHLRWTTPRFQTPLPPFSSRLSPGLHVFYTPLQSRNADLICPLLQRSFSKELKCNSHKESFTTPPLLSTRFSTTASSQFYSYLPALADLVLYLRNGLCSSSDQRCQDGASSLLTATSLDIDYDVISRVLVIAVFWDKGPDQGAWNEISRKSKDDDKVEIGILNEEKATEPEELSLGGWLTVIGDDREPKPTLFSFPSRHHTVPSNSTHRPTTFHASFNKPTGLHPTLRIEFQNAPALTQQPAPSCALHAYLTLPSTLFLDRNAFSDPLFLSSHNIAALRSISGATDLEAPEWAVPAWGSAMLFQLSPPRESDESSAATAATETHAVTIPLHARYLAPSAGGYRNTTVPWPAVFWACAAEEGAKFPVNPFDRRELGYDGLFGDRTLFYHLEPAPAPQKSGLNADEQLVNVLTLPVLDSARSGFIENGTVLAVAAGFCWVCWMLLRPVTRKATGRSGVSGLKSGAGRYKR